MSEDLPSRRSEKYEENRYNLVDEKTKRRERRDREGGGGYSLRLAFQKSSVRNMGFSLWMRIQIDLAPDVWLHSSVGRASHRYRGGHGFESR